MQKQKTIKKERLKEGDIITFYKMLQKENSNKYIITVGITRKGSFVNFYSDTSDSKFLLNDLNQISYTLAWSIASMMVKIAGLSLVVLSSDDNKISFKVEAGN